MLQAKSKILLAFPGMGKTPLARKSAGFVDADFGNYRSLLGVEKKDESKLLLPFAQFIGSIEASKGILTNEPKLANYIHIDHMYLPANESYSAKKMNVSEGTVDNWIGGWLDIAKQYSIPVTFVDTGLDYYLSRK